MAVITYKCPNCGADLKFDPEHQDYRCEYCESAFTQEELEQMQRTEVQDPVLYLCPSCGAEIVTDATTSATFCYYCHNPVVLSDRLQGEFHPDYVLPFAIDKEKALEIFQKWMKKKKYVPKAFYSPKQVETMSGVYFPYWLYSCEVEGSLRAEGTKLKIWSAGEVRYTQTETYQVERKGNMKVENVTRNALTKANRRLIESVLPFDMAQLKPFHMGYLSGFLAEKRDMETAELEQQVESEVQDFAISSLKSEVAGYDSLQVQDQKAVLKQKKWAYALMPVWTLTYKEPKSGKIYYFACNGQNGKVCGELPVDHGSLAKLFAAIFVPLFVILMIVGYFL